MTVATADISSDPVPIALDIKSAQLPLLALILKTDDIAALTLDLASRFGPNGQSPDYFDHDGVVIDFSKLPQADAPASVDLAALIALLRQYKLVPMAVRGVSESMAQAALAAGLVLAPDAVRSVVKPSPTESLTEPPTESAGETTSETTAEHVPSAPPQFASVTTLVIDKPLRSGQKAYARGGDLVVLAMVNQGAEVVADGNIHVYAPLRGKAMAGARGNTEARIFALSMEPELISIAGIYRTSENPLPDAVRGKPAQIRLGGADADKLIFEPLNA
jgi:septum site-determining protein MinC